MVDFMRMYYLEKVLRLSEFLYGIYDRGEYTAMVEMLENYGGGFDGEYDICRAGVEGDNKISALEFVTRRCHYWYRNIVMFVVLKLINMAVLEIDGVKKNKPFYKMLLPIWDDFYDCADVYEDNQVSVSFLQARIIKSIFQSSGWTMIEGGDILGLDDEDDSITDMIDDFLYQISENNKLGEPFSQYLYSKLAYQTAELDEYVSVLFDVEGTCELNYVLLISDRQYSSELIRNAFCDFIPGSANMYTNICDRSVVVCIYPPGQEVRGLEWEVDESCYNLFTALYVNLLHLYFPRKALATEAII